jgi:hypothetical protein
MGEFWVLKWGMWGYSYVLAKLKFRRFRGIVEHVGFGRSGKVKRLAESTVGEWTGKGKDGRERQARKGNQKIPLC